jgi:hypothetical protein
LSEQVKKLMNRFELNASNLRPVDRAKVAGELGLAAEALKILLESDVAAFGEEGMKLELALLVNTGQGHQAKGWMTAKHDKKLGDYTANWVKAQIAAADGDYRRAHQFLKDMVQLGGSHGNKISISQYMALRFSQAVLKAEPDSMLIGQLWFQAGRLNLEADNRILRGMLAMEAGAVTQARDHFRKAMNFWSSKAGEAFLKLSPEANTGLNMARYYHEFLGTLANKTPR